jgi:hypothetical protein
MPPHQFFFISSSSSFFTSFFFSFYSSFFSVLPEHTQRDRVRGRLERGLRAESEIEREPDPERWVVGEGKNLRAREPGEADPPWVVADEAKAKDFR